MSLLLSGPLLKPAAAADTAFRFTVETTSASEQFQIFGRTGYTYNATVDWGDGSGTSTITAFDDNDLEHTYASAGTYSIVITGTFPALAMGLNATQAAKLRTVTNMGSVGWESLEDAFYQCTGLTSFAAGDSDLSGVTTMFRCFQNCTSMTTCDMTGADLSAATTLNSTWAFASALTSVPGFADLQTPACTTFSSMLRGTGAASFDFTNWDFSGASGAAYDLMCRDSSGTFTGIGALDFTGTSSGNDIFRGVVLSQAEYDAGLIAWDAQVPAAMTMEVGSGTVYTTGGAAEAARTSLINDHGWTFLLDGPAP